MVLAHSSSRGGYQWVCGQHQRYVLVKQGLYSNKSTDLAEISASLCVVQLMHNRSPPCATTCLQLHLVLSRWPKGSALLHHT